MSDVTKEEALAAAIAQIANATFEPEEKPDLATEVAMHLFDEMEHWKALSGELYEALNDYLRAVHPASQAACAVKARAVLAKARGE